MKTVLEGRGMAGGPIAGLLTSRHRRRRAASYDLRVRSDSGEVSSAPASTRTSRLLLVAFAGSLLLWAWLYSGHHMFGAVAFMVVGMLYVGIAAIVLLVKLGRALGAMGPWPWPPRVWWLGPLIVCLLLGPLNTTVLHARFHVSEGAMNDAAAQYLAAAPEVASPSPHVPDIMTTHPQRVGWLPVDSVERWMDDADCGAPCGVHVLFVVNTGTFLQRGGYLYSTVPVEGRGNPLIVARCRP